MRHVYLKLIFRRDSEQFHERHIVPEIENSVRLILDEDVVHIERKRLLVAVFFIL